VPWKDRSKAQDYNRQYYLAHKPDFREAGRRRRATPEYRTWQRGYYRRNRKRMLAKNRARYARHREAMRAKTQALKLEVLTQYGGGPPRCACCSEATLDFLSIDHINGDGNQHRRALNIRGGEAFYKWLRRTGWPIGFQVLCMNCNFAKSKLGACPHQLVSAGAPARRSVDRAPRAASSAPRP
jgi:hypothetical protein